jgi:hypothetical protein
MFDIDQKLEYDLNVLWATIFTLFRDGDAVAV